MRRDDDYIRDMLMGLEQSDNPYLVVSQRHNSMSPDDVKKNYHIELLCDVGFMAPHSKSEYRLTSQGHDYIDAIRDATIWGKTKDVAAAVGGVTIGFMKEIAVGYLKQKLVEQGVSF